MSANARPSSTPVLDLLTEAIAMSLPLRKSSREIAEAVLTALAVNGYTLTQQEAHACEWCGRAIDRDEQGRWYAVKGAERGYDPLVCDAVADRDDTDHAPTPRGSGEPS